MCDSLGISDTKIQVYKVIDDETKPGGIVYTKAKDVIEHIKSWVENTSPGEEFEFKVLCEEMPEIEFENLPEYE